MSVVATRVVEQLEGAAARALGVLGVGAGDLDAARATGLALGQIPKYSKWWDDQALSVWSDDGWIEFPRYLLGVTPKHELEVPLAVLETLPLAMMNFSQGDKTELSSYERVIELGTQVEI